MRLSKKALVILLSGDSPKKIETSLRALKADELLSHESYSSYVECLTATPALALKMYPCLESPAVLVPRMGEYSFSPGIIISAADLMADVYSYIKLPQLQIPIKRRTGTIELEADAAVSTAASPSSPMSTSLAAGGAGASASVALNGGKSLSLPLSLPTLRPSIFTSLPKLSREDAAKPILFSIAVSSVRMRLFFVNQCVEYINHFLIEYFSGKDNKIDPTQKAYCIPYGGRAWLYEPEEHRLRLDFVFPAERSLEQITSLLEVLEVKKEALALIAGDLVSSDPHRYLAVRNDLSVPVCRAIKICQHYLDATKRIFPEAGHFDKCTYPDSSDMITAHTYIAPAYLA